MLQGHDGAAEPQDGARTLATERGEPRPHRPAPGEAERGNAVEADKGQNGDICEGTVPRRAAHRHSLMAGSGGWVEYLCSMSCLNENKHELVKEQEDKLPQSGRSYKGQQKTPLDPS